MTVTRHTRRAPAQARHPPRRPRRVPVEGRERGDSVRRQGQAAQEPGAELLRDRFRRAAPRTELLQRLIADVETIVVPSEAAVADPREQPHQGVPAPVQRPAQGRQELSLDRGHPGRSVPPRAGDPAARHPGRPVLRARTPTSASCGARSPSSAGSTRCGAAPTICPPSGASGPAWTTTSAAASRPAWAGRAGGLPADGRGRGGLPRRPHRRRPPEGARGDAGRERRARTTSAPRTCATRSAGWSGWRSRPAWR